MVNKSAGNQRGQAYHLAILKKRIFFINNTFHSGAETFFVCKDAVIALSEVLSYCGAEKSIWPLTETVQASRRDSCVHSKPFRGANKPCTATVSVALRASKGPLWTCKSLHHTAFIPASASQCEARKSVRVSFPTLSKGNTEYWARAVGSDR